MQRPTPEGAGGTAGSGALKTRKSTTLPVPGDLILGNLVTGDLVLVELVLVNLVLVNLVPVDLVLGNLVPGDLVPGSRVVGTSLVFLVQVSSPVHHAAAPHPLHHDDLLVAVIGRGQGQTQGRPRRPADLHQQGATGVRERV